MSDCNDSENLRNIAVQNLRSKLTLADLRRIVSRSKIKSVVAEIRKDSSLKE